MASWKERAAAALGSGGGQSGGGYASYVPPTRPKLGSGPASDTSESDDGRLNLEINLADAAKSTTNILGGVGKFVGDIGLPTGGHVSDAVGAVGGALGAVGEGLDWARKEFVETPIARARLGGATGILEGALRNAPGVGLVARGLDLVGDKGAIATGQTPWEIMAERSKLPEDIKLRAESGEDLDLLARELTERGEGLSSDLTTQMFFAMTLDPMNLILPGIGKAFTAAKALGATYRGLNTLGELNKLGVSERFVGALASQTMGWMSGAQQAVAGKVFGPMTNGVLKAFGTNEQRAFSRVADELGVAAIDSQNLANGIAHVQKTHWWERSASLASEAGPVDLKNLSRSRAEMEAASADKAARAGNLRQVEKDMRFKAEQVMDTFAGVDDAVLAEQQIGRYAASIGLDVESVRGLFPRMTNKIANHIQLRAFGRAADILTDLKAAGVGVATAAPKVSARAKALPKLIQQAMDEGNAGLSQTLQRELEGLRGGVAGTGMKANAAAGKAPSPASIERFTVMATDQFTKARLGAAIKSLTPAKGKRVVPGAQALADDLVKRYEPLRRKFANGVAYTPKDVMAELRKLQKGPGQHMPSSLQKRALANPKIAKAQADLEKLGYELVLEPKSGKRLFRNEFSQNADKLDEMPFVPITGKHTPVAEMRGRFGEFMEDAFRGIDQRLYLQGAIKRAVEGGKGGWSEKEATALIRDVQLVARDAGVTPRGIAALGTAIDDAAIRVLGKERYAKMMQVPGKDPLWLVMHAFEGDFRTVGATQKGTGAAKTLLSKESVTSVLADGSIKPNRLIGGALPHLTEVIFPQITWKLMPHHQWMEKVESMVWNLSRGVKAVNMSDDQARMWEHLMRSNDTVRQTLEASIAVGLQGNAVAKQLVEAPGRFTGVLRKALFAGGDVIGGKEARAITQAAFSHPEDFQKWVRKIGPEYEVLLKQWYKTDDYRVIAKQFFEERMDFMRDPTKVMNNLFADAISKGAKEGADMETLWQGFRMSMADTMRESNVLHFFKPDRSFMERSINHIFFGIYPYSYMMGKVLPEYMRFLLKRPFGLNAPLLGLDAQRKLYDSIQVSMATDPEFQQWITEHPNTLWALDNALPSNPFAVSVGSGGGLNLAKLALSDPGKALDDSRREVQQIVSRGPGRSVKFGQAVAEVGGDLVKGVNDWLGLAESQKDIPSLSTPFNP